MTDISIVPLESEHLSQVGSWAPRDVTKTLLKLPGVAITNTSDNYGWAAIRDKEVLAIVTVRFNEEHVAYLNCMVKPTEARHGIGTSIIEYALEQPATKELVHLHALVDQDNIAAQKILETQGFSRFGYGPDARLEFARHKH